VWAGLDSKGYRASPQVRLALFIQYKTGQQNTFAALDADGNWFEIPTQHNKNKIAIKIAILFLWAGLDSNQRRRVPADLQSAPVDRFGTDPRKQKLLLTYHKINKISRK
jgi:hypothetical protein